MPDPVNLPLAHPVKAHGQDLAALTLRPLTAGDLRRHGFPFLIRQSGASISEELNAPVISALIADLAGIPTSSVDTLLPSDWMEAVSVIRGFLVATTPAGSAP